MYRKREFLYILHRICIEISDIVFGRNQRTTGQEALIQAWACITPIISAVLSLE
jgi:hypothetical protein